jgi:hypothetical protein
MIPCIQLLILLIFTIVDSACFNCHAIEYNAPKLLANEELSWIDTTLLVFLLVTLQRMKTLDTLISILVWSKHPIMQFLMNVGISSQRILPHGSTIIRHGYGE